MYYLKDIAQGEVEFTDAVKALLTEQALAEKNQKIFTDVIDKKVEETEIEYVNFYNTQPEEAAQDQGESLEETEQEEPVTQGE